MTTNAQIRRQEAAITFFCGLDPHGDYDEGDLTSKSQFCKEGHYQVK